MRMRSLALAATRVLLVPCAGLLGAGKVKGRNGSGGSQVRGAIPANPCRRFAPPLPCYRDDGPDPPRHSQGSSMLVPLSWLRDYVPLPADPAALEIGRASCREGVRCA